jgi:hypothetical protein
MNHHSIPAAAASAAVSSCAPVVVSAPSMNVHPPSNLPAAVSSSSSSLQPQPPQQLLPSATAAVAAAVVSAPPPPPPVTAATASSSSSSQNISYSAERIIGNGSFGVVFEAKVVETGEIVAIKKVLQDKRFKNRELQIMRQLVQDPHPNIVALQHCFYSQVKNNIAVILSSSHDSASHPPILWMVLPLFAYIFLEIQNNQNRVKNRTNCISI